MRRSIAGTKSRSLTAPRRAPRPWLGALLSLLQAGLGHVYAGDVALGAALGVAALLASTLAAIATVHVSGAAPLALVPFLLLVVYVAIPVDAWRRAAGIRASDRPRHPELWIALLVFFVIYSVVGIADRIWLRTRVVEPFRVPSMAMAPTIVAGDWIYAVPRRDEPLRAGEVGVFRSEGTKLIKRIVALPGDTIAMLHGRLIRNGAAVDEPFATAEDTIDRADSDFVWEARFLANPATRVNYHPTLDNWGPLVVPAGDVFVLGDNRHNSRDSRYIGFVPTDSVVKVPTKVYFSWDPEIRSVRWNRIGRRVE